MVPNLAVLYLPSCSAKCNFRACLTRLKLYINTIMPDPDTFCVAPFVHLRSVPGRPRWTPCCAWTVSPQELLIPDDSPNPFMHPDMEALRNRMLEGKPSSGCQLCYQTEDDGLLTTRTWLNRMFDRPSVPTLEYVEVNFGNLCNLRCRMCGSNQSSRWQADELRLGMTPEPLLRRTFDSMNIPLNGIRMVRFSGGEPLLEQDQMVAMLMAIKEAQGGLAKVRLAMVSNGTVDIGSELMDLMMSCQHVLIQTSLDALGELNDYQRTGSRFDDIAARAVAYDRMSGASFRHDIACSLGLFNVSGFVDFADWVSDTLPNTQIDLQPIYEPAWQAACNVPRQLKEQIADRIKIWEPRGILSTLKLRDSVLALLQKSHTVPVHELAGHISRLDTLTGDSLKTANFPLYHAVFIEENTG